MARKLNVEIKAQCNDLGTVRKYMEEHKAELQGTDHQVDTYFTCQNGRLKIREGNIENYLVHYEREDKAGPKQSRVTLLKTDPGSSLKELLTLSLGVLAVVDKQREIYFIENVKFHVDTVKDLGTFIEIEAGGKEGEQQKLDEQCRFYMNELGIKKEDLLTVSYSDLMLKKLPTK